MRSTNLFIIGCISVFTTLLTVRTFPVGARELHYWALVLGMFASAACVSWLFFTAIMLSKSNNIKGQFFILLGYALALALCVISGGCFGVLYFTMHAQDVDFITAFKSTAIAILGGYSIAAVIFGGVVFYLIKQRLRPIKA